MTTSPTLQLPFYQFFERLRQNEFAVGTGEYEKFLFALEHWMGMSILQYNTLKANITSGHLRTANDIVPREKLLRLCKTLLLKPGQNTMLFEEQFDACFRQDFGAEATAHTTPAPQTSPAAPPKKPQETVAPPPNTVNPENGRNIAPMSVNATVAVRVAIGADTAAGNVNLQQPVAEIEKSKFLFTRHYYPVDRRKIQQHVKQLPVFRFLPDQTEMDEVATVDKIIEKGFFHGAAFKRKKRNVSSVLLMIDFDGSMIAFEQLSAIITAELKRALSGGKKDPGEMLKTVYFYNVPHEQLSLNQARTIHEPLAQVLKEVQKKNSSVIIISDAGAARGQYNRQRVTATLSFLRELQKSTSRTVWLNPLPATRWQNTSARDIAAVADMFEANENGIKSAVKLLKGSINRKIKNS